MRVLSNLNGDGSKINASEVIVAPGLMLSDAVIVEKGENVNGSYIKFGDGTIICRRTMSVPGTSTARGALFASEKMTWRYPVDFTSAPYFDASPRGGSTGAWRASGDDGASALFASFRILNATSTSNNITIELFAIGR